MIVITGPAETDTEVALAALGIEAGSEDLVVYLRRIDTARPPVLVGIKPLAQR